MTTWRSLFTQAPSFDAAAFAVALVVVLLLSLLLQWFYVKFGRSLSNRQRLARSFFPLALTTMIIISVVKSSLALSLGLVGALSIIRFRSAIKDPQELVYLFIAVAIGIGAGAGEILLLLIGVGFFFVASLILHYTQGSGRKDAEHSYSLSIKTHAATKAVGELVSRNYPEHKMKSIVDGELNTSLTYEVISAETDALEQLKQQLYQLDPKVQLALVENPDLSL